MKAAFCGSFDPITLGHIDIIERASWMFDFLLIGIGHNPDKPPFLPAEDRWKLITPHAPGANSLVKIYSGLTVDFAKDNGVTCLIRGVRDGTDLKNEMYIARLNRKVSGIETLFLTPSDEYIQTSSTFVRHLWQFGTDPTRFDHIVPENVAEYLRRKIK